MSERQIQFSNLWEWKCYDCEVQYDGETRQSDDDRSHRQAVTWMFTVPAFPRQIDWLASKDDREVDGEDDCAVYANEDVCQVAEWLNSTKDSQEKD